MSTDNKRELVLPPSNYAYMQDVTKGTIKTFVGPTVINASAQEVPVVYEHKRGFERAASLEQAVRQNAIAVEGSYLELFNPTKAQPQEAAAQGSPDLEVGRRVNLPGPVSFALWPGQYARSIRGHHLRHNQFLIVRVYNAEEAEKNWGAAIVRSAAPATSTEDKGTQGRTEDKGTQGNAETDKGTSGHSPVKVKAKGTGSNLQQGLTRPDSFAVGMKIVIKGTEVSFYIPPTGIVVEADGVDEDGKPKYVREALTLERLEYCILVKENGTKRYERGPQVVFPEPDERFIEKRDDKGNLSRKFAAIELNEIQGLHIKVISPYTEGEREYTEGQEMFITGKDTPIYFPREEHSVVRYDGKTKHFATAIPRGEGRYVMNRKNGEIKTTRGPAMLLPNPVDEVIVRRALSDMQCLLWYPDNDEILEYNRLLRGIAEKSPTTRSGAVSEGELLRNAKQLSKGGTVSRAALNSGEVSASMMATSYGAVMESSRVSGDQDLMLDEFSRASNYTSPRSITLNTKYQGVPSVDVWTGYAVQVKDRMGGRRVVKGPATELLAYDEDLEVLELSTGKPKTTDTLLRTVYLLTTDNKITDIIEVETRDHVRVLIKLSYRVNFEGDSSKWFSVANYVKLLCDHGRSMLKGQLRLSAIGDFYADPTSRIRDTLLGKKEGEGGKRAGLSFSENGMRVVDVDVLSVEISDKRVRDLLDAAQFNAVQETIRLTEREGALVNQRKTAAIDLEIETLRQDTHLKKNAIAEELLKADLELMLTKFATEMRKLAETQKQKAEEEKVKDISVAADRERLKADSDLRLAIAERELAQLAQRWNAEADSVVKRVSAVHGGFSEALLALSNNETAEKIAKAWSVQEWIGGRSLSEAISTVFKDTPLWRFIENKIVPANGASKVLSAPAAQS